MKRSIFARNMLLSAGMVLLSLFVLSFVFALGSYTYIIREKRETLRATAGVVADVAAAVSEFSDLTDWSLGLLATSVSRATGTHIFLCDETGAVVACSDGLMQCDHLGARLPDQALLALEESGGYTGYSDLSGFYDGKRYISGVALYDRAAQRLGSVFASAETGDAGQMWRGFTFILLLAACFVLLLAIPASVISSRREAAPLREMAAAARQFARGDLSVRVHSPGRTDEVGELSEAFNQMAETLEKSEHSRRDFIANVSHELKTPMTTISGFADGLLDGTIPMENASRYLGIIASETKRLSRLVRQMLELSRARDAADPTAGVFDIAETVRRALISLESSIGEKRLQLRPELPEDALRVRGSGDAVSQVVHNILDNAVKFAEPGSELNVRVFKQGGKAYISVVDRGETIPEAELPEIFQRFHKSDRSRSLDRDGVGLGLYIVKTILDELGEDIWVRSRDGETEFRFSLTVVS